MIDKTLLIEWLANNYKEYGTNLEIITDRSQEGAQFCRGFGGIGGTLDAIRVALLTQCALLYFFKAATAEEVRVKNRE